MEGIKLSSRKISDGRKATSKRGGGEEKKHNNANYTGRGIIFYHHNGLLDQPEVVEANDHVVEQQQQPTRLAAEQHHLERQVLPDLGKNSHQERSYEGTCYRVVVADGVAAAERDDRNPESTAEQKTERLVGVAAEEMQVNPRRSEGLSVVDAMDGFVENRVVDFRQGY